MEVGGNVKFEAEDWTSIHQRENCEMCNNTPHDGTCSQCKIYVCQVCFDNHLKIKFCNDHVLLQDADINKSQYCRIRFDTCSQHKQQEVRLYCTEHKCFGCAECILLRHNSCKWEYIVEASNRFQNSGDLDRLIEDVQNLEYTIDEYIEAIDKHTETAETMSKSVLSNIETFTNTLVEYVAKSKQQALNDAQVRESAHQHKLDKLKVDIQSLRSQVEAIITDFREEGMIHKHFILAVESMPKVARFQNEIAAIDCNNVITEYTFRPSKFLGRMISNTRPIGKLIDAGQTEVDEDDDEDINLKKERDRSLGLEGQIEENQKMMSKLKEDIHDMEQAYNKVVKDKQSLEQNLSTLKSESQTKAIEKELDELKTTNERVVKDKQSLEQQIDAQKSNNQKVVSKLNKDIGDLKKNFDTIVKDKQSIERELSTLKRTHEETVSKLKQELADMKQKHDQTVILSCGHANLVGQFDENKLMACCKCGIIYGDQPNGAFTSNNEDPYTKLTFTFPNGTQSTLNRNPGRPYSGKRVTGYLRNNEEGKVILKMMILAFQRKCFFTVDNDGKIENGVELFTDLGYFQLFGYLQGYREYIVRVRQQLEKRGIKEFDVTQS